MTSTSKSVVGTKRVSASSSDGKKVKSPKLPKDLIGVRPPYFFINLPNSDVRYTYPKMFCENLNNGDPEGMKLFMNSNCDPNCTLIYVREGEEFSPNRELIGVHNLTRYWDSLLATYPDYLVDISGTSAQFDPQTNSAFVSCSFASSFTRIYEEKILVVSTLEEETSAIVTKKENETSVKQSSVQSVEQHTSAVHVVSSTDLLTAIRTTESDDSIDETEKGELVDVRDDIFSYENLMMTMLEAAGSPTDPPADDPQAQAEPAPAAVEDTECLAVKCVERIDFSRGAFVFGGAPLVIAPPLDPCAVSTSGTADSSTSNSGTTTTTVTPTDAVILEPPLKITPKSAAKRKVKSEPPRTVTVFNPAINPTTKSVTGKKLPKPITVKNSGKLILHLDGQSKITKIVYVYKTEV